MPEGGSRSGSCLQTQQEIQLSFKVRPDYKSPRAKDVVAGQRNKEAADDDVLGC